LVDIRFTDVGLLALLIYSLLRLDIATVDKTNSFLQHKSAAKEVSELDRSPYKPKQSSAPPLIPLLSWQALSY